ncbi:hypothetical protein HAP95_00935 [Acidithiobacillus sp. RW2]|uniref:Heavy metal-binding domain-containing protein n=1 Tax=Acidithiobacillus sulfurivorans TaxID=1958756 RepID=A0ABS5ZUJ9_9PROT|nr:hypothetical protein [Acidithiobacillus sulfurivorans]
MKTEPVEAQKISLSTTENRDQNAHIIAVVNRAMYGECSDRQPEETLAMLQEKALAAGAISVIGVQLVPVVDDGIMRMMAYGTAIMGAKT